MMSNKSEMTYEQWLARRGSFDVVFHTCGGYRHVDGHAHSYKDAWEMKDEYERRMHACGERDFFYTIEEK